MTPPLHVLYGGAHLFKEGVFDKLGARALAALDDHASDFSRATGANEDVIARVRKKLTTQPIDSMCIDFEDGYGVRSDEDEDRDAERIAPLLVPRTKVRIKADPRRGHRTLMRVLKGAIPDGFTVTLPKVTAPEQVAALASVLRGTSIGIELMIEAPRALLDVSGRSAIPALIEAGDGKVTALHLGAYDLTAELGVTAGLQRLDHPYCDLARMMMKLAAPPDITIYDGATNILPIGDNLHDAWALHASNVRRAIDVGIWQGWDLHPAQLPARFAVVFQHFLERKEAMTTRLRTFIENASKASRVGQVFDDAATGQGLLVFFARGLASGALENADLSPTGLTKDEILARSFADIVAARTMKT